ncbi:MAG: NAD(P)-dependent oxidoreductase [Alphaproteobacteria bacterium]|nr:MAG: NAD(P)-dependent oxidoreductase [Alphaproteobacteria bacterium]
MNRVLITGAAGRIGRTLRAGLGKRYRLLRLLDLAPLGAAAAGEEVVHADIGDLAAMEAALEGIDCVVHLAGVPEEDVWEKILPANIVGTYNVFEAARRRGTRRIVFASTNHVVGFHPRDRRLDEIVMPRPDTRYGASKAFGEALGRLYADKHGISVACLRIGSLQVKPQDERQLATWISPRDTVELVRCCIEAPDYHFLIVYGVSNNRDRRWFDRASRLLGYAPQDDAEAFAAEIRARGEKPDAIAARFHGGPYCAMEFSGRSED